MTGAGDNGRAPRAVLVTGHQRTGTSAFRDVLRQVRDFADCGEICSPLRAKSQSDESFFTFLRDGRANGGRHAGYTDGECWEALEAYLAYLEARHPRQTIVLDVKYDFLHNFNSASWLFTTRPLLFEFAKKKGLPVLHFTRQNLLEAYCSLEYGRVTGKWHYGVGDTPSPRSTFRVEPAVCLSWLVAARDARELVRGWLGDERSSLELDFEQLFQHDRIRPVYAEQLEKFLNATMLGEIEASFRRTPVSYRGAVENLDEVAEQLEGSEFAWMVEELH